MSSDPTTADERLAALIAGPRQAVRPSGAVMAGVLDNGLLFLSGQVATTGVDLIATGRLGDDVDAETGIACARQCALNLLGRAQGVLGSLSRVRHVLKVTVFVASAPGFREQHIIANSVSEILVDVLGDTGRHARAAIGVAELPLGSPVEVEATIAVD